MSNNNQNGLVEESTWSNVLEFTTFTVDEAYQQSTVMDVLTTLRRQGGNGVASDRGAVSLGGGEQDGVGTTSLQGLNSENEPERISGLQEQFSTNLTRLGQTQEPVREEPSVQQSIQPTVRNTTQQTTEEVRDEMSDGSERTISLNDLFNRQSRVANLDTDTEMTLRDMAETDLSTTYSKPDLRQLTQGDSPLVEFGEEVIVTRQQMRDTSALEITKEDYETFNTERLTERDRELQRERERQSGRFDRQKTEIERIVNDLFNETITTMYGFDKVGRFNDGRPYIKAVVATRFSKLYDRRFRKREEMTRHSRNVAVANKFQSIKGFIELTIKGEANGDLVAEVKDSEGERILYLEQKLSWIKSQGISPNLWVLFLKTQYEFEDTMVTLDEMREKEFNVR